MTATLEECRLAAELRDEIYGPHPAGCCWHVVLDDLNVGDGLVESTTVEEGHEACAKIKPLLLKMSPSQRKKLAKGGYA